MLLLISIISFLVLTYLSWGAVYQFVFSLAGVFYQNDKFDRKNKDTKAENTPFIRVFIPAYREDGVILNTAQAALRQEYPAGRFEIIVIADGLQAKTVTALRALPVQVLEVQFEKSTKSKALNRAIQHFAGAENADVAVVLDADNIMQADFLDRVAHRFAAGARALQGRRAAKNGQNHLAILDAASEDVNNHILCRGQRALGFSARLAGSGMAFDYALFAEVMPAVDAVGGFDKELELRLTQRGICIEYDEKAIVLDEKISQTKAFSTQRSRWISAQFRYAKRFLPAGIVALFQTGNLDFFNKTLQMALPPRLLSPGLLALGALLHAGLGSAQTILWAVAFLLNLAAFAMALPHQFFQLQQVRALAALPQAFLATLLALARVRKAGRVFIVTPKMFVATATVSPQILSKNKQK